MQNILESLVIPSPDRKITELLTGKDFTVSAEIVPPRNGASPAMIMKQIETLKVAGAQFLAVTKGAGGSLRGGSLPIAQTIKESFKIPCIAHFTCRDLLPEEVENQLVDHHFFGIRNILALRGDPPRGVPDWKPKEGSYPYAYQLVEQIRNLNQGQYLERSGFAVTSEGRECTDFCIGVAVYPDHQDIEEQVKFLKRKVDAGAEFAISQMLFDADSYARFVDACAKEGLSIPILPGTQLLKSQPQAEKISQRFQIPIPAPLRQLLPSGEKDLAPEKSLETFLALTEALKKHGAPGIHLFVLNDTELAKSALDRLKGAI